MRDFPKTLAAVLLVLAALLPAAHAQLQVDLGLKRTLYLAYEPLIANVSITNLSGNSLNLRDSGGIHWFGFQIETLDGRPIAPLDSRHTTPPLLLKPGEKLTRPVNLTPLFPITEYGGYRIRAAIHVSSLGRLVSYGTPEILLDRNNQVHVLQNVAPKAFLYSHIGLNGEVLARKTYQQNVKRPALVQTADDRIAVIGAREFDPEAAAEQKQTTPSLSDRPVPLPGADTDLAPADEKRPKNLLSN